MPNDKLKTVETQFTLAKMWHVRGKYERAIEGYKYVINLKPDYTAAHLELGGLLLQQNRLKEAIEIYEHAAELIKEEPVFEKLIQKLKNQQKPGDAIKQPSDVKQRINGKKHILLFTDCPDANGVGQCNHMLMLALISAGYTVTCAQPKFSNHLIVEQNKLGIAHKWIEHGDIYQKNKTSAAFSNFAESENLFNRTKPDLIIFASGCPLSSLAAKQTAANQEIPFYEIIHCVTADWAKQFASHTVKLPQIYGHASTIITVSQDNLNLLRNHFGLPEGKGQVIYNGRPDVFFNPPDLAVRKKTREDLRIPFDAIIAFTTGRMEIVKGYQYLVDAIKKLMERDIWPNLYFVWAGEGTVENNLRATIERLGAKHQVKFLGHRDDIPALLDTADIFVLPSQFEGMPLSIMEAMAKGLPVIATSVSGIPEELGETGKLLPDPGSDSQSVINQLSDTIEEWARDKKLRLEIGNRCKERAEKLFRADAMLKKYIEITEWEIKKDR